MGSEMCIRDSPHPAADLGAGPENQRQAFPAHRVLHPGVLRRRAGHRLLHLPMAGELLSGGAGQLYPRSARGEIHGTAHGQHQYLWAEQEETPQGPDADSRIYDKAAGRHHERQLADIPRGKAHGKCRGLSLCPDTHHPAQAKFPAVHPSMPAGTEENRRRGAYLAPTGVGTAQPDRAAAALRQS